MDERVRAWLRDTELPPAEAQRGLERVLSEVRSVPQARPGVLARWGFHDAGIPRQRVAFRSWFAVTTLAAAMALFALGIGILDRGQDRYLADDGRTYIVGATTGTDYATIADAMVAAVDGDTVVVLPGVYREAVVVDQDITLRGDGPAGAVVIAAPDGSPVWPRCTTGEEPDPFRCSLVVDHADATITDLTFRGDGAGITIHGGGPVLERLTFERVGRPHRTGLPGSGGPLSFLEGSMAVVRDSEFRESAGLEIRGGSAPVIEANALSGGTYIAVLDPADEAIIRANDISDAAEIAIELFRATRMTIEGNTIRGTDGQAIQVGGKFNRPATGIDPRIVGNTIVDTSGVGVAIHTGAMPVIDGNTFLGNRTAIRIGRSSAVVVDNVIAEGSVGVVVVSGGDPTIVGNDIDVSGRGIAVAAQTHPLIEDNEVCGGDVSISVAVGAEPRLAGNRTCAEPTA